MSSFRRTTERSGRLRWVVICVASVLVAVGMPSAAAFRAGDLQRAPAPACLPSIGIAPSYVLNEPADDLARDVARTRELGGTRYRFDVDWSVVEPTKGTYNWGPVDRVLDAVLSAGLTPLGVLAYAPPWAEVAGADSMHGAPIDTPAFAAFAGAAAARYAGRINDWEIWNEPNNNLFWSPVPDPAVYTALLKQSYPAIKAAQPNSTVLAGALAPGSDHARGKMDPLTFLARMYDAGARGSFDALSVHPYSYPWMPTDSTTSSWSAFQRMPLLHDLMTSNGDGGKSIWVTEFGAPTGTSSVAVSPDDQAKYLTEGLTAMSRLDYVHTVLIYSIRDSGVDAADPEQNFGLLDFAFSPKPAFGAVQRLVAESRC